MTIGWHFDNSYSRLPKTFKEDINPVAVNAPEILILNKDLVTLQPILTNALAGKFLGERVSFQAVDWSNTWFFWCSISFGF